MSETKRQFTFNKNGTKVTLEDPNPDFSVQEVLNFYSGQYPELTTASVDEPVVTGNTTTYKARTTVGTKA